MINLSVDWTAKIGTIKPLHGVGQPPFAGCDFSMFHFLTEAGIPFSRLHDVGGLFSDGVFVDIPNIFKDFTADPSDPASYDFAFTDYLLKSITDAKVEPFYRLGVSIENYCAIKQYRLMPPSDPLQWAKICEGIIRHYNEGWADGFHMGIRYWEIWNEPDNSPDIPENMMWWGTDREYFNLYDVTAKHLKSIFPDIKIGGYASSGLYAILDKKRSPDGTCSRQMQYFIDFFDNFLEYIKEHKSPIDFFSWHSYGSIKDTMVYSDYVNDVLVKAGYSDIEQTCNEWNCEPHQRGTLRHAANTAGMMLAMQDSTLDSAMFYDARFGTSMYGGLFNPMTRQPLPTYYSFVAFNELYKLKKQVHTELKSDVECYACAASDECGGGAILITNVTDAPQKLTLDLSDKKITSVRIITEGKVWEETELPDSLDAYTVLLINVK